MTCAACAFVPGETVPSDLPDGLCPLTASNKNALHAKTNIEKGRCAALPQEKATAFFFPDSIRFSGARTLQCGAAGAGAKLGSLVQLPKWGMRSPF